jgi:hypothetical protein
MASSGGRQRLAIAMVCAMGAAVIMGSRSAEAFQLKHSSNGKPLLWARSQVSYVLDGSVEQAVPGGAVAVSNAVAAWSGTGGGPPLSISATVSGAKAGLDGQNSVLFASNGFAPAGNALAVTVTSYDVATGDIIDTDIVVNGIYPFAVLSARAEPANGTVGISTDGSPADDTAASHVTPFDLGHVVSHEIGHTLGLADERDTDSALMYAFTMPGDASTRAPATDDVDGLDALYAASLGPTAASPGQSGCGQASMAGSRARPADAWGGLALVAGAGVWLASRGRFRKAVRFALPIGAALVALVVSPASARSAPGSAGLLVSASARVVDVSTSNVGGVFETTIELAPTSCREQPCPARVQAHAWGGTLGGITQEVGGGSVPGVGDLVDIAFVRVSPDVKLPAAALVTARH